MFLPLFNGSLIYKSAWQNVMELFVGVSEGDFG